MKKKAVKKLIAKAVKKAIRALPPGPPGLMGAKGNDGVCKCVSQECGK